MNNYLYEEDRKGEVEMAEYQWAQKDGKIVVADYNQAKDTLSSEQLIVELKNAFNELGYLVKIEQADLEMKDVYKVIIQDDSEKIEIYICAKGTTPGGRDFLMNEQRIQVRAKYWNYVYAKLQAREKAISLGIYKRDGETIFCAWKLQYSKASSGNTPVSKQIKIQSIAKAIQNGFVQQDRKGNFVCAFKKEYLKYYLDNSDILHEREISTQENIYY